MRLKTIISIIFALCMLSACHTIPVGYLQADNAEFVPNVLNAYRTPDPATERAHNNAPWVSTQIQGVSGTNPVNYEFVSAKVANGGDLQKFLEAEKAGYLSVEGGIIYFYQEGVKMVPNGDYILTLRVYNEGHSKLLQDIITIRVSDVEPESY